MGGGAQHCTRSVVREARDWKEDGEEMVEDKSPALTLLERFILTSSNSESTHLHGPRYKLKRGP